MVKNKDDLVGIINGYSAVVEVCNQPDLYKILADLTGSHRYSGILHEDFDVSQHTIQDLLLYVQNRVEKSFEVIERNIQYSVYDDYLLPITCTCGSFTGYATPEAIPEEDVDCANCGRKLIQYIGHTDFELAQLPMTTKEGLPVNINEIYTDMIKVEQEGREDETGDY